MVDSFLTVPYLCVVATCTNLEVTNHHRPFSHALMMCITGSAIRVDIALRVDIVYVLRVVYQSRW